MQKQILLIAMLFTTITSNIISMSKDEAFKLKQNESIAKVLSGIRQTVLDTGLITELRKIVAAYVGNLHDKFDASKNGHTHNIYALSYSPNGQYLISGGVDRTIKIWDMNTKNCKYTIDRSNGGHNETVQALAYSPDGQYLVSSSSDHKAATIKIWNLDTCSCIKTINSEESCYTLSYSPMGQFVAAGFSNGDIKILDTKTYKFIKNLKEINSDSSHIRDLTYSPNGQFLTAGRHIHNDIKIWDMNTYNCVKTFDQTNMVHFKHIYGLTFSPDSKFLASASGNHINIFDMKTLQYISTLMDTINANTVEIRSLQYSKDGQRISAGRYDGSIQVWDVHTQRCIQILDKNEQASDSDTEKSINSLVYSPCGQYLASASGSIVKIWIDIDSILLSRAKLYSASSKENESKFD